MKKAEQHCCCPQVRLNAELLLKRMQAASMDVAADAMTMQEQCLQLFQI